MLTCWMGKAVERWRLKALEKENNLENRVIQEVGWDGTRVQVLDRKKDVPFLEMEGWSEAK